jgi:excisionase family DNA binding protein
MSGETEEQYLTVQEAAESLTVTESAVRQAILDGRLLATEKYGRKVIHRTEVEAYRQRTQPGGAAKAGRPFGSKKRTTTEDA